MNTHTSVRGPTSTERMVRTALPFGVAAVVSAPTVMHALDGTGSWMTVALVAGVTLSAVWVLCAIGLSLLSGGGRSASASASSAGSPAVDRSAAHGRNEPKAGRPSSPSNPQPLARIAVARVPADQAIHADVDGHVTAATSTMGVVR